MDSVGDMARSLVLRTNQVRLRQEMDTLAVELSTGFKRDPGMHLAGDLTTLTAIDRSLARLDAFEVSLAEGTLLTTGMQATMEEMQQRSTTLAQALISADLTPSSGLLDTMANDARDQLGRIMSGLNRSVGGRFLFSGVTTDTPPVMELEDLMTELVNATTGLTTVADIDAALDTFFGAGGTYETTVYLGSNTGLAPLQIGENDRVSLDVRATDQSFREILQPIALAALAGELALDTNVQVAMLGKAGEDLMGAQQPFTDLRASVGLVEAQIEDSKTRNAAEVTASQMARVELIGIDDYETATQYEAVRSQLDSLYAITARSQRLSLAEYL